MRRNSLWEVANPETPIYKAGAVGDAREVALGGYLPDGILPTEADMENKNRPVDYCSVYVTGQPILPGCTAL